MIIDFYEDDGDILGNYFYWNYYHWRIYSMFNKSI